MRYLMMHRLDETKPDAYSPSPELIAEMGSLIQEMTEAGVLLGADGVSHSENGALVRVFDGKTTVVDGPFTEAKEVIGGYALLEVKSKDEAIEWASRFAAVIGDTEVEIRLIYGQ